MENNIEMEKLSKFFCIPDQELREVKAFVSCKLLTVNQTKDFSTDPN